jgi:hypothetical protein
MMVDLPGISAEMAADFTLLDNLPTDALTVTLGRSLLTRRATATR